MKDKTPAAVGDLVKMHFGCGWFYRKGMVARVTAIAGQTYWGVFHGLGNDEKLLKAPTDGRGWCLGNDSQFAIHSRGVK